MSETRMPGQGTAGPGQGGPTGTAGQLRQEAAGTAQDLKREATGAAQDIKREGAAVAEAAKDRALGFAEEQQQAGAEQAESLARAVHGAADQLQQSSPQMAQYVHEAASAVDGIARNLRHSSPGQLMGQIEDLARRQPVAFFGAAVLAGFALARFAKASAEEAHRTGAAPAGHRTALHDGDHAIGGGRPVPHSTAAGAPGWVQGRPDDPPRPATVAAASLGGSAARSTQQAGQTRPVNEAG